MKIKIKLLNCPFCGGKAVIPEEFSNATKTIYKPIGNGKYEITTRKYYSSYVKCSVCDIDGQWCFSYKSFKKASEKAAEKWNSRSVHPVCSWCVIMGKKDEGNWIANPKLK